MCEDELYKQYNYEFNELTKNYYLIKYIGDDTDVVIPSKIDGASVALGHSCFENTKIKNVVIQEGINKIPDKCFANSTIEKIEAKSVTLIGLCAFKNCKDLQEVKADEVRDLNSNCFENCQSLKKIEFESDVIIRNYAFQNCKINNIIFKKNVNALKNIFNKATINNLEIDGDAELKCFTFKDSKIKNITMNNCTILPGSFFQAYVDNIIIKNSCVLQSYGFDECDVANVEIYGKVSFIDEPDDFPLSVFTNDVIKNKYVNTLTDYKKLKQRGFDNGQINQILKAQNNGILISAISPETPTSIIRKMLEIRKTDIHKFSNILTLTIEANHLENIIKINEMINDFEKEISNEQDLER